MSQFLAYLEQPELDPYLINEVFLSLSNKNNFQFGKYTHYQIFPATKPLKDFTRKIFNFDHIVQVQKITKDLPIHIDFNRQLAFNYIIETGGEEVKTCFYNANHELIEEHIILKHKWHCIRVNGNHNVKNITSQRIALTVNFPPIGKV